MAKETATQRKRRLEKAKRKRQEKLQQESEADKSARLAKQRKRAREVYEKKRNVERASAKEQMADKHISRLASDALRRAQRRANETTEAHISRLARDALRHAQRRANETTEARISRLESDRLRHSELRARGTSRELEAKLRRQHDESHQDVYNPWEQETGRRPSRRAALVAAKKIFNTVRNFGISDNPADRPVNPLPSPKSVNTPHPYTRPKPKKNPPVNVDLQMECCDDFLSPIQAEFLLKAQIQYNMVMKNLRELMACNVKVIQTDANGVPTVVTTAPSVNLKSGNVTVNSKSPGIKRVNTGSAVVVPMTLIQSPIIIT